MRQRHRSAEHEATDAAEEMALYELAELGAARELSVPSYVRDGIASGRLLQRGGGGDVAETGTVDDAGHNGYQYPHDPSQVGSPQSRGLGQRVRRVVAVYDAGTHSA
jgi:hypothetical protein